jgi:hypothetical protein
MKAYVRDMNGTLILLKSLLDGSYAGVFHVLKDCDKSTKLCDQHFFYEEGQLAHKLSTVIHGCYLLLKEQMVYAIFIFQNWICYNYPFESYFRFPCTW